MSILLFFVLTSSTNICPVPKVPAYLNGEKVFIQVQTIPSHHSGNKYFLNKDAAHAFRELHAAAAMDGHELRVNSAFRKHEEQKQLFRALGPNIAAKPGYSNHQHGSAVDIADTERFCGKKEKCPTIKYWWLKKNAHKYGFYQTVSHERWHWDWTSPND